METLTHTFPCGPKAVGDARRALDALNATVSGTQLEELRLMVSELVTNSVRHADSKSSASVGLDVHLNADVLRVEVVDEGTGFDPKARTSEQDKGSGWGLFIVEQLASDWGVKKNSRTRVWFEVPRQTA